MKSDHAFLCSLTINDDCFNKDTWKSYKNNSYEQELPLVTIGANFQVCVWGGGGGGGVNFFLPVIMSYMYEFIVFWKSFEY